MTVLKTRLFKPVLMGDYIKRVKIFDYLDSRANNPLTLVIGAAGYGKSIAISQWLDHTNAKYCWISLDQELNELGAFLAHIVFAVRSVFPEALEQLNELIEVSPLPTEKIITDTLINELAGIKEKLVLVLNDYHSIRNQQIHNLIEELLKYYPHNLQLVLISRRDPPLNLSRLKAYGRINEIRMSRLAFDIDETKQLVQTITHADFSDQIILDHLNKIEGWVVGLRVVLMAFDNNNDIDLAFEEIKGDKHQLSQYLLNEILNLQNNDVRKLLMAASLPDRFNKGLLKKMLKNNNKDNNRSFAVIDNVFNLFSNSTLFIIPLDFEGEWFRYHYFLREFLHTLLLKSTDTYSASQIKEWHQNASEYFYNQELFDEAITHAIKCDDYGLIVKIIEVNKYKYIDATKFVQLGKWLNILPKETIEKNLSLLLTRAFLEGDAKDYDSMRKNLVLAKNLLAKNVDDQDFQKQLQGEYYTEYGILLFSEQKFEDAYTYSLKGLELLSNRSAFLLDYAIAYHAFSLYALGRCNEAASFVKKSLIKLSPSESVRLLRHKIIKCILYSYKGNLSKVIGLAHECHKMNIEKQLWSTLAYSTCYLSETNYQLNNLYEAVDYAKTLDNHYYTGRKPWIFQTLYTKAFALNALNKSEELGLTVELIKEVTKKYDDSVFNNLTSAFEVELTIRQNDISKAVLLAKKTKFESFPLAYNFYFPQLTFVKIMILADEPDGLAKARKALEKIIELGRTSFNNYLLINALSLQSLFFCKKNDHESAIKTLKESLKLAEPGGFIRVFVDLGIPIKHLLENLYSRQPEWHYISKLLDAFSQEETTLKKIQDLPVITAPTFKSNGSDILLQWEINLLKLICEGYQNKEIAAKLFLSPNSIKKYVYVIYQKLEVKNRAQAINRAKHLNII